MGIKEERFSHYTFDAGENKGEAPTFYSKSELSQTNNVENRVDGIETRYGSSILSVDGDDLPTPLSGNPVVKSILPFAYDAGPTYDTLYTAGDKIYRDPEGQTSLKSGLSASGARFQFAKAGDIIYMTNGTDPVYFYEPLRSTSQVYTAGYDVPGTFTATPSTTGGSMASGDYGYFVTLFDDHTNTESDTQAAEVAVTVVGPTGSVELTDLPLDSEGRSTHWIIYRLDKTSGVYYYKIDKITYDAGARTYTDVFADTGSAIIAPTDNTKPDPSDVICLHGNIMVYAKGNVFTWSLNYRFQNVPTYNRETLFDNSYKITKMVSYGKALVIWKTDSMYVVTGDLNRGTYVVSKMSNFIGTRSPDTVCESPTGIYFLDSTRTPRYIDSTDFNYEDLRQSTDISFKYRKKLSLIPQSSLENCHAVIYETSEVSQWRLYVPVNTTSVYPNHCYIFDYGLAGRNNGDSAWFDFHYSLYITCSGVAEGAGGVTQIQAGDDYGLIWKLDEKNQFYDGREYFRPEGEGDITFGVNTIDISTAALTVNYYVGTQLILYDRYTYREVFRSRVVSNTETEFTLETNLPTLPTSDPAVSVGGYLVYFATAQYTNDRAGRCRPFKMSTLFSSRYDASDVQIFVHYDFNEAFNYVYDYINNPANSSLTPLADNYTLTVGSSGAVYDAADSLYDTSVYGLVLYGTDEFRLASKYLFTHVSWGAITREPSTPFAYLGASLFYQFKKLLGRR